MFEDIRARAEAATPGPWKVKYYNEDYGQGYGETTFYVSISDELFKIGIADKQADLPTTGLAWVQKAARQYITLLEDELRAALTAGIPLDRLEAICAAEKDGRLLTLPSIKLYKTLYWIWGGEIMPVKYMGVRGGCVDSNGMYHVNCQMKTLKDRTFVHSVHRKLLEYTYKAGDERYFYADDIGKTVFIDRESAHAKLQEGQK